jgi:hypothetical protein
MIKSIVLTILVYFLPAPAFCQDASQMLETARLFMQQKDYANSILILNRAIVGNPQNAEIGTTLALNYYFLSDFIKAREIIKPVLELDGADDQSFQIAGDISKALEDPKDAEKIYVKGLKKFPESGALYNEFGELLWTNKNENAIKQWEKGIMADPGFSKNYYNASKYYYQNNDLVWSLLYGEIFINIEPAGSNGPEIKAILLEQYKKLFSGADLEKSNKQKNEFAMAFVKTMNLQSSVASYGINAESLSMIRTRFILDWFNVYETKFPFRLFEMQRQLIQEGLFDAYNQWIFGAAQNLSYYQSWINNHSTESNELNRFQKGRIFKIPSGQYYH